MSSSILDHLINSFNQYEDTISFKELNETQKTDISNNRKNLILLVSDIIKNRVEFRVIRHCYYLFKVTGMNKSLIESIDQNQRRDIISEADIFNLINQYLISLNTPRVRVQTESLLKEFIDLGIIIEKTIENQKFFSLNTFAKEGKFYYSSTTISKSIHEDTRVVYSALRNLKQKKINSALNISIIETRRSENRKGSEYYAVSNDGVVLYEFLESRFKFDDNFWSQLNKSCVKLLDVIEDINKLITIIKNSKLSFKRLLDRFKSILGKSIAEWNNILNENGSELSSNLKEMLREILKFQDYTSLNYRSLTSIQDELGTISMKLKASLKRFNNNPDIMATHNVIMQFEVISEEYSKPIALILPIFLEDFLSDPESSNINSSITIGDLLNSNMFNELSNDEKYIYNNINIFENTLREEDLF